MRSSAVIFSALSLLTSVLAVPAHEHRHASLQKRQHPVMACSATTGGVHVIASGGDGAENIGVYGRLGTLARNITSQIPGSTSVQLPYDKSRTDGNGLRDLNAGAHLLHEYIFDYSLACPKTKIVLIGYSAGAIIQMNTLCGASKPFSLAPGPIASGPYPHLADNIIAAVAYGDQTRTPGPSYDIGSGGQQCHGRWPRKNADRCVGSFPYQSYCDVGDPECCVGPNTHGYIHFTYPDKYDAVATQFVLAAFRDSKA